MNLKDKIKKFVNIHQHTTYSTQDGFSTIDELLEHSDHDKVVITDHGNMSAVPEFYNKAKKAGRDIIIGQEFYLKSPEVLIDRVQSINPKTNRKNTTRLNKFNFTIEDLVKEEKRIAELTDEDEIRKSFLQSNHLIILAKNLTGYKNLVRLSSLAYVNNFYNKPHTTIEDLEKYKDGLIVTTACLGGYLSKSLRLGVDSEKEKGLRYVEKMKNIFGEDFYIELQYHDLVETVTLDNGSEKKWAIEKEVNTQMLEIAKNYNIKTCFAFDNHYMLKNQDKYRNIVTVIGGNYDNYDISNVHHLTSDELEEIILSSGNEWIEESICGNIEISEKIEQYNIYPSEVFFPKYFVPIEGMTPEKYFKKAIQDGFKLRGLDNFPNAEEYKERVNYEHKIISDKGYNEYFLVMADVISFFREGNVKANIEKYFPKHIFGDIELPDHLLNKDSYLVGAGRGSGAGSLIAYLLEITDIDPIEHNLLFERFLNPDRPSLPDIDTDFQEDQRSVAIDYLKYKYGVNSVAQIITFMKFGVKQASTDVLKLYEPGLNAQPFEAIEIADALDTTLKTVDEVIEDFKLTAVYQKYASKFNFEKWAEYVKNLTGKIRQTSMNACGICITNGDVWEYVPVMTMTNAKSSERLIVSQYDKEHIEDFGIPKFDFLGLKNLSIIKDALNFIEERHNVVINEREINIYDPKIYELYQEGKTQGLFQLGSDGMTHSCVMPLFKTIDTMDGSKLFELGSDALALYRPGPMDNIPELLDNLERFKKTGNWADEDTEPWKLNSKIKPILDETNGIVVYQEQVMRIAKNFGYSGGEADVLRKAIGKKIVELLNKEKSHLESLMTKEMSENDFNKFWSDIESFASYAFNKSHAVAYHQTTAKTAWLKYYYPNEFIASDLDKAKTKEKDKFSKILTSYKKEGYNIFGVDINFSRENFYPNEDGVYYGLSGIKGIKKGLAALIDERLKNGDFKDIYDFIRRTNKFLDFSSILTLVKSGAFDKIISSRKLILENEELFKKYYEDLKRFRKYKFFNDSSLIEYMESNFDYKNEEYPLVELSLMELDLMNLYFTDPFPNAKQENFAEMKNNDKISSCFIIPEFSKAKTKKGKPYLKGTILNNYGETTFSVFNDDKISEIENLLYSGRAFHVDGKINFFGSNKIIIDKITSLSMKKTQYFLSGRNQKEKDENFALIKSILDDNTGNDILTLIIEDDDNSMRKVSFNVDLTTGLKNKIMNYID